MKRSVCFAFAIVLVQISITEAGLIKKLINNVAGRKNSTENQNYKAPTELNESLNQSGNHFTNPSSEQNGGYGTIPQFQGSGGGHEEKSTKNHHHVNSHGNASSQNNQRPSAEHFGNRPDAHSVSNTHKGGSNQNQNYHNLTGNTVSQSSTRPSTGSHGNRPDSQGNSNNNNGSSSQNQQYKNTTWYIENEEFLTPNENASSSERNKPNREQSGKKPEGHGSVSSSQLSRPKVHQDLFQEPANKENRELSQRQNTKTVSGGEDGITLQSNSVTCYYSNIKDEKVENRKMTCNHTDCTLEKNYDKSSLWICKDIKCTVANVDFTKDHDTKKLIECSMDARNIITVQDKPLKCPPNEKEHNGRCRRVFDGR